MKQYLKYFRVGFILLGVCAVITLVVGVAQLFKKEPIIERGNTQAPKERVYDYADVLTDEEEENLRDYIAKVESKIHHDVVLVTLNESVLDMFGYEENTDYNWDAAITTYADDFYDYKYYGYNEAMGDGVILVDNWFEGEKGSKFSTAGNAYEVYTYYMVDEVLDAVYDIVEYDPYRAYMAYVETVARHLAPRDNSLEITIPPMAIFVVALIPAIIFIVVHLKNSEGKKTTTSTTYVDQKAMIPRFIVKRDDFITKSVTSVRIESSSSSGGSSRSGGGRAGGHRSSSGRSHGGGSRRR